MKQHHSNRNSEKCAAFTAIILKVKRMSFLPYHHRKNSSHKVPSGMKGNVFRWFLNDLILEITQKMHFKLFFPKIKNLKKCVSMLLCFEMELLEELVLSLQAKGIFLPRAPQELRLQMSLSRFKLIFFKS